MIRKILFILSITALIACDSKSDVEKEIEKIQVDFEVMRFDKRFADATPGKLGTLKEEFPFFFPPQYHDSVWINKISDTIQQEINTEVAEAYPKFSEVEDELQSLFQHVKYYFPTFEVPDVYTVTSEVDYKNKVIYTGSKLLISLDTYLGEDHPFYMGIQEYLKKNFEKAQIVPDAATAIAQEYVPRPKSRTFLAHMIYYGKILYLKDIWIPFKSDAEKMGYTEEELEWARKNEAQTWRYFVEKEVLFDTNSELYTRFLYPAPFSKFYLLLDSETPDRLGQYIAWQMLRQYMDKNDVSIQEMLDASAEELFNDANYKPKK
ncbi:gliding motility lipoprotein GldB [Autumnicola psychrophila]|uniref:Gliding motility lipoprotein GldB n=1 Tax=Autumnicola psychrophila TaxID=3075592 RepID=A0ABU3DM68_9FLAO|nr:gliding motility lipoprotein GldB [Zunongwangia sp. F225]MDT0684797.1 gliding motility lipoprotein GldB [Zunongwangia sp. F225]